MYIYTIPSDIGEYLNSLFSTICCSCFYFYFYFMIEQFFLIYCKFFCQKESLLTYFTYLLYLLTYR